MVKSILFYIFITLTIAVLFFYFTGKSSSRYADILDRQHQKQQKYLNGIDSLRINKKLNYFTVNKKYITTAKVTGLDSSNIAVKFINDKNSVQYTRIALLSFKLNNQTHQLTLFRDNKKNNFTLPFTDSTNTNSTHSTGRYLPIDFKNQEYIDLDFNMAYNPYCAYDSKYSCIISPKENLLSTSVKAGELRY